MSSKLKKPKYVGSSSPWSRRKRKDAEAFFRDYGVNSRLCYPDEIDVGAIFVFERAATDQAFFQTAMLTLPDGAPDDALGRHLDFRFGRIVAGSRGRYLYRGGAYVWEKRGLGWRLIGELLAEGGAPIDRMGWGISIADDGTAIVG